MQPKRRSTAESSVAKSAEEPNRRRSLRTKAQTKVESVNEEEEDSTTSVKASAPKKPRSQDQKEATVVVVEEADSMRVPKTSSPLKSKKMAKLDSQDIKEEDVVIEEESSTSSPEPASQKKPKENEKQKKSDLLGVKVSPTSKTSGSKRKREIKLDDDVGETRFIGESIPEEEAKQRWPRRYLGKVSASVRYQKKKEKLIAGLESLTDDDSEEIIQARCHYRQAEVDGHTIYNLYEDAHVNAGAGNDCYICKIVEMFEAVDGSLCFTAQWYYRANDTVIKDHAYLIDSKRVFFSEIQNDNPLDSLVQKLNIVRLALNMDSNGKKTSIANSDYYCDMMYLLPYSTFVKLPSETGIKGSETSSTISSELDVNDNNEVKLDSMEVSQVQEHQKLEMTLLDLYAGCGAMSTGLCFGAKLANMNLVTRWAVDINQFACDSLKLNHPETEVRNESAEDFVSLIKEWEKLCVYFSLTRSTSPHQQFSYFDEDEEDKNEMNDSGSDEDDADNDGEVFEVAKILAICYGDPKEKGERELHFKVRWKGYGADADSWEPIQGLSNCRESIKEFITNGYNGKILPLPGDVDVVCGGPPCQGISGFNRFRNRENPLDDPKNKQLLVFMEVVEFLKPKFVLMENVVDILKFAGGFLGRYALGRLVSMDYQSRMGMMAAGAYGLPQFRMRVFIWGALSVEKLPQYPLPTHDVVIRGGVPVEFEGNTVAYDEGHTVPLEKKLLLEDAISDLPTIENSESQDELSYDKAPKTDFQRYIRLSKGELLGSPAMFDSLKLYDHRPLQLNEDDYQRVCRIPKKKGANFRDLPGVFVRSDNIVEWDPNVERVYLDSGKPLVPDYAMTFVKGRSSKPFGRLWWDETVPTVVTRAEPHNQKIIHPDQDRVLSIRENSRLQGFPDFYKLCGPIKERYIQVGNAVAVPVARALGYGLGLVSQGIVNDEPLFKLPPGFPNVKELITSASSED